MSTSDLSLSLSLSLSLPSLNKKAKKRNGDDYSSNSIAPSPPEWRPDYRLSS
jgi:hypothetical protein